MSKSNDDIAGKNYNNEGEIFNDYEHNVASGTYSHAEGYKTTASHGYSHAEGNQTTASRSAAHAEGTGTTASGYNAHAEGDNTTASGMDSHAEGNGTLAESDFQHAQGKFNVQDLNNKYADIIGCGTDTDHRANLYTVDWNGNLVCGKTDENGVWISYGTINGVDVTQQAPSPGNGTLTINQNDEEKGTFKANQVFDTTINLTDTTYEPATSKIAGLMSNTDKVKLDTIEKGAQANIQSDWNETDDTSAAYIKNKPTDTVANNGKLTLTQNDIEVGTFTANQITDVTINLTDTTYEPATDTTDGLMSSTDKVKLDSIEDGAEVNVQSDWTTTDESDDSYIKNKPDIPTVNDAKLTVKVNDTQIGEFTANSATDTNIDISVPTKTSDLTNDSGFITADQDKNTTYTLNQDETDGHKLTFTGSDGSSTSLTIPDNDTTYNPATTTEDGLMSSDDKTKLDSVADGAEVNVQSDWDETDTVSDAYILNKPDIPVVNDATLTIKQNNVSKGTFTANQSVDKEINLTDTTYENATTTTDGLMSSDDKTKIDSIENGAEVNVQSDWDITDETLDSFIKNKPEIPTVNNGVLTIKQGENPLGTFSANQSTDSIITIAETDLTNYYTKSETYNKSEVNELVSKIPKFSILVVDALPTEDISTTTIYLLKASSTETGNMYDEYIYVNNVWEKLGTQKIDLSNYYNKTETDDLLDKKADTDSLATVATSGSYNDLSDKPTIPTVNDATLTIKQNNSSKGTFTANQNTDATIELTDTTYDPATTTTDGLMSSTDKSKLDNIAEGAEINVQSDWSETDETADSFIKNKPEIPTVNNAKLTIKINDTEINTFTANADTDTTANITVPTKTSDLTNDSGYVTENTTYAFTQDETDGHKITLTPSIGTATTLTIPDNDTKYTAGTTDYGTLNISEDDQITISSAVGKNYLVDNVVQGEIFNVYSGDNANIAVGQYSHAEGENTTAGRPIETVNDKSEMTDTMKMYKVLDDEYDHYHYYDFYYDMWSTTSVGPDFLDSHAEGKRTYAIGTCSHAEGIETIASGNDSHAEGGADTHAMGRSSHAEGGSTTAKGICSHSEGGATIANGTYSHAEGYDTIASCRAQHVQGQYNVEDTENRYADIVGNGYWDDVDIRSNIYTLDWDGNINCGKTDTEGNWTSWGKINGVDITTLPKQDTTYSAGSTDYGTISISTDNQITLNNAVGKSYLVDGIKKGEIFGTYTGDKANIASGGYSSHAEGYGTEASGDASHSEGINTKASGGNSHAEGTTTTASGGYGAHAEGNTTTASGNGSHAEGFLSVSSGGDSHAEGKGTISAGEQQHTQGRYNIADTTSTYATIIGNGTSDDNRLNIYTLDWNGNVNFGKTDNEGNWVSYGTINGVDVTKLISANDGKLIIKQGDTELGSFTANQSTDTTITVIETDLSDYYTKSETYNQEEVNQLVSEIPKFSIVVVDALPTEDISTTTIYLLRNSSEETGNIFDEYIYVNDAWEKLGSQKIDLSNYYTKDETDDLLDEKADTDSLATVATSGSYNDLSDKPTIPTVNNATLTIKQNNASKGTFTANASSNKTISLTDTTYTLTQDSSDGHKLILTSSTGTTTEITIPDNDTTYDVATESADGLMSAGDKTKLDGISEGAEVNVQSDWNVTDTTSDAYIKNKPTIPTKVSELTNDAGYVTTDTTYTVGATDYGTLSLSSDNQITLSEAVGMHYKVDETSKGEVFNDYTNNQASGENSHAEGNGTTASGDWSHSEGYRTKSTNYSAHAEGYGTTASGEHSHAECLNTTASYIGSHAEGAYSKAKNTYAHAEGNSTTASGNSSHAEGGGTTASGAQSHAEGYNTTASGGNSHAEGGRSTASGGNSHAEGSTTASGEYSHAEGAGSKANGHYSHAEGVVTTTSGPSSHAEGNNTVAGGMSSHAEGYGTIANSDYQHAQGTYNVKDDSSKYADIVGNGTGDSARSNIYTLDWDGNLNCGKTDTSGNWTSYGLINGVDITKLPTSNTTYTLVQDASDGHKITFTGSDGTSTEITIPDSNDSVTQTEIEAGETYEILLAGSTDATTKTEATNKSSVLSYSSSTSRVYVKKSNGGFIAMSTDGTYSCRFGVGSGGVNRGIYDNNLSKWMVYADDTNIYLQGNADTATKATQDANGLRIDTNYMLVSRGTAIPSGADLNDYTTAGVYYSTTNAISQSLLNAPSTTMFGNARLEVFKSAGATDATNSLFQKYYQNSKVNMQVWIRSKGSDADGWSPWHLANGLDYTKIWYDGSDYDGKYMKVASMKCISNTTYDYDMTFHVSCHHASNYGTGTKNGILKCHLRRISATSRTLYNMWEVAGSEIGLDEWILAYSETNLTLELWHKCVERYVSYKVSLLSCGTRVNTSVWNENNVEMYYIKGTTDEYDSTAYDATATSTLMPTQQSSLQIGSTSLSESQLQALLALIG